MYSTNDYRYYDQKKTVELYHHGIQGQKWGIRRYQNPDGSLTPEGRIRYGSSNPNESYNKRESRIRKGIKNQQTAERLALKGKTTSAKYLKNKEIADLRLADASPEEIKLGESYMRLYNNATIATILAGVPGAVGYGVVDSLTSSGKERRELEKQVKDQYINGKKSDTATEPKADTSIKPSPKNDRAQFEKDVAKANSAKTDEEHDRLNREADDRYAKAAAEARQYYSSHKSELMKNAREKDQYDMEFLERSNPDGEWDNKRYLSEYDKYLDDPYSYQPYEYRKNK